MIKKGFTLIEVMIALTVFSAIMLVSVNTFVISFRSTQKTYTENVILEDARFILKRLETLIANNDIDYEEYFSRNVVQTAIPAENRLYGQNHNLYAWQFFDGGRHPVTNQPDGIGTLCQAADSQFYRFPNDACITGPLASTEDNSTGAHPAIMADRSPNPASNTTFYTNAFCVPTGEGFYNFSAILQNGNDCDGVLTLQDHYRQEELYLISPDKTTKYLIKPKEANDVLTLALAELQLETTDGLTFGYRCADEFICSALDSNNLPIPGNSTDVYQDFVPITPLRTDIKSIDFIIAPLDDPELAFAENFSEVRMQPQVTILLTVGPAERLEDVLPSEQFELTLQTTVTANLDRT